MLNIFYYWDGAYCYIVSVRRDINSAMRHIILVVFRIWWDMYIDSTAWPRIESNIESYKYYLLVFNQRFNYPTPPYEDQETQSPPNYTQPSAVSFPSENEIYRNNDFDESDLLMAQQDTLLAQLDNSHITNSNSPPAISPNGLPLPGQWFLGREEPSDDFEQVLSELSILNNMQPQVKDNREF